MGLILVLVFFGVFVTCALLLSAGGAGAAQQSERARANLSAALASGQSAADPVVDVGVLEKQLEDRAGAERSGDGFGGADEEEGAMPAIASMSWWPGVRRCRPKSVTWTPR